MHKPSAKIKHVRPFKWVSQLEPDSSFGEWTLGSSKISVEIGCGSGLHPIFWSQQNPHEKLIAVERTKNKFKSFNQRFNNHKLPNLFPVNEEAYDWLPANIQKNSISNYFFLYPNPYPKEGQANKRWYRSPFFHFVLETLIEDGEIHFATNEEFLFEEAKLYALEYWRLQILQERRSDQGNWSPRTHFEKKYLKRGEVCYDITFCKALQS